MSLLTIADSFYIGVADVRAASAWYTEKLGLRTMPPTPDDEEGCVALGFSKEDHTAIVLGPRDKPIDGWRIHHGMDENIGACGEFHEILRWRGIARDHE